MRPELKENTDLEGSLDEGDERKRKRYIVYEC